MICFLLFLFVIQCSVFDKQGVKYEDDEYRVLELAPEELTSYTIPKSVEIIRGGDTSNYAFLRCKDKLKTIIFSEGSNLHTLEKCSFYKCVIEGVINMSYCTKLLTISEAVFSNCKSITNIIFPPYLEIISSGAFNGCSSIKKLIFPSSLQKIAGWASLYGAPFGGCTSLEEVDWGDSPQINYMGSDCFNNCGLKRIYIPSSLININQGAFAETQITKIEVNNNNKQYCSDGNFLMDKNKITIYAGIQKHENSDIKQLTVPDNILHITGQAFRGSLFTSIILPQSLLSITGFVFSGCKITSIKIGPNVNTYGDYVFQNCVNLETVELSSSANFSNSMFTGCINLKEVIIPKGTRKIGNEAFYGCKRIQHIFIPSSVTTIGSGCFANINLTAKIEFEEGSPMKYHERIIYTSDYRKIISYLGDDRRTILIKSSVETIGAKSFINADIDSVTLSTAIKIIEDSAFEGSKITSITIPMSVTEIGERAFAVTNQLSTIAFEQPQSRRWMTMANEVLKVINKQCFSGSMISSIVIPASIESIKEGAFMSCSKLTSVSFDGRAISEIGPQCFKNTAIHSIIIPRSVASIGRRSFEGSELTMVSIEGVSKMETLTDGAFIGSTKLTAITLAEGIKCIGDSGFERCSALESIRLCVSLENISVYAFKDCTSLKTVEIPDTSKLKVIEELAFDGCTNLMKFDVSDKNENFISREGVLYDSEMLKIIIYLPASPPTFFMVPETIKEISAHAFRNARNLVEVLIPDGSIQRIGFKAFCGCTMLSKLTLPSSLTQVDFQAFAECPSLKCGSIVCDELDRISEMLINAQMPEEALHKCQTAPFTAVWDGELLFGAVTMAPLFSKYEDENSQPGNAVADIE